VLASFDGQFLLEWKGNPSDLELPPHERPRDRSQLWIGTVSVPVRFHKLLMKSISAAVDRPVVDPPLSEDYPWPYDPQDGVQYVWSEPENAGPGINSSFFDEHPEVSPDGLTLWLSGGGELWTSQRSSTQEPFGRRVNAGPMVNNGRTWDSEPSLTADGLQLFFCSDRDTANKDVNLWSCSRSSLSEPWAPAVRLNSEVNSRASDLCPAISGDGKTLYFTSSRQGGSGGRDIWSASRPSVSDEFTNVTNLGPDVNSPQDEHGVFLSNDGLVLMFASRRSGGRGDYDLYFSSRSTVDSPFGKPTAIGGSINSVDAENGPCLAEFGRALYFYSNRSDGLGHADIWVSRRVPRN
jgi:Tol biopolymer transport system component